MPLRHQRSAVACQACRQRKVRCSLTVTGVPCAGCSQDHTECVVTARRPRQRKHVTAINRSHPKTPTPDNVNQSCLQPDSYQTADLPASNAWSDQTASSSTGPVLDFERNNVQEEERNANEIAEAVLGRPQRVGEVPFYTGEQTGPTSALDICTLDRSLSRHFLIPSNTRTPLCDEDREYLKRKGVFTLPKGDVCDGLLRAYLCHVHPIMPVVDVDVILNFHQAGRLHEYNMLLLWCVFFGAVNFISPDIYEQEGYKCRKDMKATMYSRAKCMYDNGGETNKIILLQASILLGFWHSEQDEHTQPWYWTGVAINLCQMLGLHRDPDCSKYNSSITDRQRCQWRRLWWTCFFRDRWLGLTLGRPLRINLHDCDTPMPLVTDLLHDMDGIPESTIAAYMPVDMPKLAEYWVVLIELSKLLGVVLSMNYRAASPRPSLEQVEGVEAQILQCRLPDQHEAGLTRLARFYSYHVHLHYHALLITFYRPYGTDPPNGLPSNQQEDWHRQIRIKADASASQTNDIITALAHDNLLEFAGPMTPPLLIPAMQTHLLNCKSADSLSKRLRLNKLEMCMMVMEELQKTYTVASIYRAIFTKAIQQIFPRYPGSTTVTNQIVETAAAADRPVTVDSALEPVRYDSSVFDGDVGGPLMDDTIQALMDEALIFDFCSAWNPA